VIGRLAIRSLTAHPVRSAVLAAGFGVGVSVMAILLGVAEIVLSQARAPALVGGGDVLIRLDPSVPARMLVSGTLQSDALRDRVDVAAPWHAADLFLLGDDGSVTPVEARGGIPSLERALGDPETMGVPGWEDTDADRAWRDGTPTEVLRQIDRFHAVPDAPAWGDSWAEWLYFNGRAGDERFYLTFLVGGVLDDGRRPAGVRLQLAGPDGVENFSASATLSETEVARAPELTIAGNTIELRGLEYHVHLDLRAADGRRAVADLVLESAPGRLLPPLQIAGARGWRTGYVVPVMSGTLDGTVRVDGRAPVSFAGGRGYHDHNWGFWEGVSWQWGQVQDREHSFLYGRVFPPAEAADADRIPGFIGAIGPDGPLGYASNVRITEENGPDGEPDRITIRGRSQSIDVTLTFSTRSSVRTRMDQGPLPTGLDFLQLQGTYLVTGEAGDRLFDFSAPGSAETFRQIPRN
jgi:hypothetical protein